jgi:hypothetical protein
MEFEQIRRESLSIRVYYVSLPKIVKILLQEFVKAAGGAKRRAPARITAQLFFYWPVAQGLEMIYN